MKTIIMSEKQVKTIKPLLNEAASLEKIVNAISNDVQQNNLSQSDIADLIMTDPTAVTNQRGSFVGKYWKWIYNQYKQGNIKLGDRPELEAALKTYNINKSQINRPIDSFNTLDELVSVVADYDNSFKAKRTLSKGERELEKVYEDKYVKVYIPHTWEAARKIGGDTRWCTASSNDKYFNYYLNSYGGEYYDIIRKSDGAKFQLHVESGQFMDANDDQVGFVSLFNTKKEAEGLMRFLKNKGKDIELWLPKTWPDEAQYKLNSGIAPESLFDKVHPFNEGYAIVRLNKKYNYINTEGKLLSEEWWDSALYFSEGYAVVKKGGKCNYINTEGKLLTEKWWDAAWSFSEGYAVVKKDGKCNYINTEGKLFTETWWDYAWSFREGYAVVEKDGKYNYINTEGKLLSEEWWDDAYNFNEGYAVVKKDGKWNFINKEGKLLSETWLDSAWSFNEGYAKVKKDGKWYKIVKNGKVYGENGELVVLNEQALNNNKSLEKVKNLINRLKSIS